MEVFLNVWGEDLVQQNKYQSNTAYYTFVALDAHSKPVSARPLEPETEADIELFNGALRRRQVRLILGGKMKPGDAKELKALFEKG